MFLGQFKPIFKQEDEEPKTLQKPPEQQKSPSTEAFIKTPETQSFIKRWSAPKTAGQKAPFTKRGIVDLLSELHGNRDVTSDKAVLSIAERLLMKLGNMDGLQGFLIGMKAKTEGIFKTMFKAAA